MRPLAKEALAFLQPKLGEFKPKHAIVLGSGLGDFVNLMSNVISISYDEIPGFRSCTVSGHKGSLEFGTIQDQPIVCLAGRPHYFEGADNNDFLNLIRTIKLLGCETFISVSAVGSLRESVGPGEVVLVTDHINFPQNNPLVGAVQDEFGSRFLGVEGLYNLELRTRFKNSALKKEIRIHEGVYFKVLGPVFETPAEIRAFRILGGDVIGMSTVPEALVAHHCGLKVAVLAAVTNLAAGMSAENLSHDVTLRGAKLAAEKIKTLLVDFIGN